MKLEGIKAPFPWFGGKSDVAAAVWERFGNVPNYIEPFFGSGAMLLGRPTFSGIETVNDKDGLVCNFWRAVQASPDEVAKHADWPVNECDLHARHHWLVQLKDSLAPKLEGNPDFYDAKIAGWWCWGMCCWIGSGFCSGDGPWKVMEVDGIRQLVHLSDAGRGETASESISATREGVYDWMRELAERLQRVRVCCGDWRRVTGGRFGNSLKHFFAGGNRCAVFLDPPYSFDADRTETLYREDGLAIAHDVRNWAISQGNDPRLRIALCGYDGEHEMPDNWSVLEWKARGGYASVADGESNGKANAHRERIWFSPHCEKPSQGTLL